MDGARHNFLYIKVRLGRLADTFFQNSKFGIFLNFTKENHLPWVFNSKILIDSFVNGQTFSGKSFHKVVRFIVKNILDAV